MKTVKWLVTVAGRDPYYTPPDSIITVTIDLEEDITPVDWFHTKPKVYSRFEFVPNTLVNFWKLEINEKKTTYINTAKRLREKEKKKYNGNNFYD